MGFLEWRKSSYPEFYDFLKNGDVIVLLPTGSIEQHGPHLPLDTDCFIAEGVAREAAVAMGREGVNALLAPPLCPGLSAHWKAFPGTLTLSTATFSSLLGDVVNQVLTEVSSRLLVVNGHGGNSGMIQALLDEMHYTYPDAVLAHTDWWKMLGEEGMSIFEERVFAHAEEVETSVFLALGGQLRRSPPGGEPREWPFALEPVRGAHATVYRPVDLGNGVFGEPRLASREKGERALGVLRRNYVVLARMLLESTGGFTNPM